VIDVSRRADLFDDADHDALWVSNLDTDACWALLAQSRIGRISFVRDGRPHVSPVNHLVDDHSVVLGTDRTDALGELDDGSEVVFEVDDGDPDAQTGRSVIIHGRIVKIDDTGHEQGLDARGLQPWTPGPKDRSLRVAPFSVTGRAVSRRPRQADDTLRPYMRPD
jgi:nitroimidazol reductase NimA-like FMN-containing flavoprotein (pyridoxamine 5'-phosphate oxidase superfamily)